MNSNLLTVAVLSVALTSASESMANEVKRLDPDVSSQGVDLPVLDEIPDGALVVGGIVLLAGIAIGLSGGGGGGGGGGSSPQTTN